MENYVIFIIITKDIWLTFWDTVYTAWRRVSGRSWY